MIPYQHDIYSSDDDDLYYNIDATIWMEAHRQLDRPIDRAIDEQIWSYIWEELK